MVRVRSLLCAVAFLFSPLSHAEYTVTPEEQELGIHRVTYMSQDDVDPVIREMQKLPASLIRVVNRRGGGVDVMKGQSVVEHPSLGYLRGEPTTTNGEWRQRTYDELPAVGGGPQYANKHMVVLANSLHKGHGSVNLVLHEYGHTVSNYCGRLAQKSEWVNIHRRAEWEREYERMNVEEAFAESFALYFTDASRRGQLPGMVREYFGRLEANAC